MVELLVDKGADIHGQGGHYGIVRQAAFELVTQR
jgi:hypothetical protein